VALNWSDDKRLPHNSTGGIDEKKLFNPFPTDFFGYNVAEAIKNGTFPTNQLQNSSL
jgi:hypothetical protein